MIRKSPVASRAAWVPDREEVIWIHCNAQAGREMRDVHLFLVLSPRSFNERTSLVIGLPMTTAEYNADNPFAVANETVAGRKAVTSYILCHQPKSFDWRLRRARPHAKLRVPGEVFVEALARLNQIIQLGNV